MKVFDAFPKVASSVRDSCSTQTLSGGIVSLLSLVFLFLLLLTESYTALFTTHLQENLIIDDSPMNYEMRLNFDLTFHALPCSVLGVDAIDAKGERHDPIFHSNSHIYKKRIDPNTLLPIGQSERNNIGNTVVLQTDLQKKIEKAEQEEVEEKRRDSAKRQQDALDKTKECGNCYGAASHDFPCCNTCNDVRQAYLAKGWSFTMSEQIKQCQQEGVAALLGTKGSSKSEKLGSSGCNMYGYLSVPRRKGAFHFAPSSSFQYLTLYRDDGFGSAVC
eukprot:g506.t1